MYHEDKSPLPGRRLPFFNEDSADYHLYRGHPRFYKKRKPNKTKRSTQPVNKRHKTPRHNQAKIQTKDTRNREITTILTNTIFTRQRNGINDPPKTDQTKSNNVPNRPTHAPQNSNATKPKPKPNDTRWDGDHPYWVIKMFIYRHKNKLNKNKRCTQQATLINSFKPGVPFMGHMQAERGVPSGAIMFA